MHNQQLLASGGIDGYCLKRSDVCRDSLLYTPYTLLTPEKCVNPASFLRLDLPFTLVCHESGAFQRCSLNRKILKTSDFCASFDGNHFKKEAFRKW